MGQGLPAAPGAADQPEPPESAPAGPADAGESAGSHPVSAVESDDGSALLADLDRWAQGAAVAGRIELSLQVSVRRDDAIPARCGLFAVLRRHDGPDGNGPAVELGTAAMRRLADEAARGQARLGEAERSLLQACCSDLLADADGALAPQRLIALLNDPAVARLIVLDDGERLRAAAAPLRLEPAVRREGARLRIDLMVREPQGGVHPLSAMQRIGSGAAADHVLVGAVLSRLVSDLPEPLLEEFLRRDAPLAVPDGSALPALLAEALPELRTDVDAHTQFHRSEPLLVVSEEPGDWLRLRLLARPAASGWQPGVVPPLGPPLFEWRGDGTWAALGEPPAEGLWRSLAGAEVAPQCAGAEAAAGSVVGSPTREGVYDRSASAAGAMVGGAGDILDAAGRPADCWLERPRREDTQVAEQWLARHRSALGLRPRRARGSGLWMRMVPRRMDALAAACCEQPDGLAVFASGETLRFFDPAEPRVLRLRVADGDDHWLAISAEWAGEMEGISEVEIERLRTADQAFVRLASGWQRREIASACDRAARMISDLGLTPGGGVARVPLRQLAGAAPTTLAALENAGSDAESLRAARSLRERIEAWRAREAAAPPAGLHAELRPYQREGFEFLVRAAELETGAVLADDMGLGKTLQTLAWIAWLREREPAAGPVLVVAPASVTHNWQREAERFVPGLRVLALAAGRERARLRARAGDSDLVITNYALLRRDMAHFRELDLQAVVLDEAQTIKNPDSSVTAAVLALRASYRLALTGTPLENRPLDLWSILRFTSPGWLGSRAAFARRYETDETSEADLRHLEARLRPVLLRRRKRDVAKDLPERVEEERMVDFSPEQRRLYLAEVAHVRRTLEEIRDGGAPREQGQMHVLAALTRLRQICCHPGMIGSPLPSAKLELLLEILEPLIEQGQRVLVFSQFVRCLELLRPALERAGVPIHMLTGATSKREEVVARFRESEGGGVFLLSLMAAGTGLNLTEAPYVVLFDPWWNPAIEAQAIDRAHRIGQDRTVVATRLVARGTIEERILALQRRKQAVADAILGTGSGRMRAFSDEEIDFLLGGEAADPPLAGTRSATANGSAAQIGSRGSRIV